MASLFQMKNQAKKLAKESTNDEVIALAKLVAELCATCEDLERKVADAEREAKRARRDAKG